jgi:hypothetical protein
LAQTEITRAQVEALYHRHADDPRLFYDLSPRLLFMSRNPLFLVILGVVVLDVVLAAPSRATRSIFKCMPTEPSLDCHDWIGEP